MPDGTVGLVELLPVELWAFVIAIICTAARTPHTRLERITTMLPIALRSVQYYSPTETELYLGIQDPLSIVH